MIYLLTFSDGSVLSVHSDFDLAKNAGDRCIHAHKELYIEVWEYDTTYHLELWAKIQHPAPHDQNNCDWTLK